MNFKDLFFFERNQQRGVLILIIITFILLIIRFFLNKFDKIPDENNEFFKNKIDSFYSYLQLQKDTIYLCKFSPDTMKINNWISLGFKKSTAQNIISYVKKGGKIQSPDDLRKIYGINDSIIEKIKPYFVILKKQIKKLELNSANINELKKINGIGNVFAKRIIKYRNLLGGYYSKKQLLEVYGIDTSLYNKIKNNFYVDKSKIKKININSVSFKNLLKHPYFNYELTKKFFNFKQKNNGFKSINEIYKLNLPDTVITKIIPYIEINDKN